MYPIDYDMKFFYMFYKNIISKNPSLSIDNEIIIGKFKFKGMSLESKSFKTFFIIPYIRAWTLLMYLFIILFGFFIIAL